MKTYSFAGLIVPCEWVQFVGGMMKLNLGQQQEAFGILLPSPAAGRSFSPFLHSEALYFFRWIISSHF